MKHIYLILIVFLFHQLSFSQEEIWGYNSLAGSEGGGILFKVNPETQEIENIHRFGHAETEPDVYPENGQNPYWLCQGANGNLYGMTYYGGIDNKGVFFGIDIESHEFSKKMDLADVDFDIEARPEAFSVDSARIIGIIKTTNKAKEDKAWELCFMEYNSSANTITKKVSIPSFYNYADVFRINSNGFIYFNKGNMLAEYSCALDTIVETAIPEFSYVYDVFEYQPGIYMGSGAHIEGKDHGMVFTWDRNTNEIQMVFSITRLATSGNPSPTFDNKLFCSKDNIIYGDYWVQEGGKISWLEPFVYNINSDEFIDSQPLSTRSDDHRLSSFVEANESPFMIRNLINGENPIGKIGIYNQTEGNQNYLTLEDTPYWYESEGDNHFNTDAPFLFYNAVDIICVNRNEASAISTIEKESQLHIYCHNTKLQIKSKEQVLEAQIFIFDLSGRLVYEFSEHDFTHISRSLYLAPGGYVVQIRSMELNESHKILVN